ncbi:MAG TPA: hypothetical protein VK966_04655, partial [Longimicrobiales bacterium]|nr:hypothetical protein [Longimicrobiales bacterium]
MAIPDFLEQATPTSCDTILTDGEFAVTQLRTATDSTWLLLDEPQRQILEFTGDLRQVWSLPYRSEGPGSLVNPSGVAPLGDSAFAVVDRGSLRLMVLDRAGEELYSTPLGFLPNTVATTPDGQVLVTPLPIENRPGTLLVRFDGGEQTELPVPPRYYESFMVRALGNTALVETLADGSAVVMHQYMAPRGFLVDPDGEARQLTVPMPDGTVRQASFVPTIPLTDDQQSRIMLPAASMSVDRRRSELFVLTRSGGRVNDRAERAILRLGRDLSF